MLLNFKNIIFKTLSIMNYIHLHYIGLMADISQMNNSKPNHLAEWENKCFKFIIYYYYYLNFKWHLWCTASHLAQTVLTTAELLALLQLHTLQELSQHSRVLQLWVLLGQGTLDTMVPGKHTRRNVFKQLHLNCNPQPQIYACILQQNHITQTASSILSACHHPVCVIIYHVSYKHILYFRAWRYPVCAEFILEMVTGAISKGIFSRINEP